MLLTFYGVGVFYLSLELEQLIDSLVLYMQIIK